MNRLFAATALLAGFPGSVSVGAAPARASAGQSKVALYFEANHGETDASVKFFTRAAGYNLYLTASQAVIVLPQEKADKTNGPVVVRMKLKGANVHPSVRGRNILPGHTSYFLGQDPAKWQAGVERYSKVEFKQVYPGIDMVYYGKQGHVEHDFVVAPGADPGRILIGFEGGKGLRLDPQGNLILSVEGGALTYQAPKLYQRLGTERVPVKGRYLLAGNNQVRFAVGDYIKSQELVIDPELVYSSYLGGSGEDKAYAVAVDASGNVYLTGYTASIDFPGISQSPYTPGAASEAFVTKITSAGALAWSAYLGGTGINIGNGIAVDRAGKVHITGSTTVSLTFPQTASFGSLGGTDAFVAALSADGKTVIYSDVFGGTGVDSGNGIAVDAAGNAYVTGVTPSGNAATGFPVTPGAAQPSPDVGTGTDVFAAKFSSAGAQVYATFLGGDGGTAKGNAIAIDSAGQAYITGQVLSGLPYTSSAFNTAVDGPSDAFIAILNQPGSAFTYVTYVGGENDEAGTGIAVDRSSPPNVYITGNTNSDTLFPGPAGGPLGTVNQTTLVGTQNAFVFKLHPFNGGGVKDGVYATYLGGSGTDGATAIAVDRLGNAYVTGNTTSGAIPFPTVNPLSGQGGLIGSPEAFVTQVSSTGASYGFSTYLGGTQMTAAQGIALDGNNNIYVAGWTNSGSFPTANAHAIQTGYGGGTSDAFVTKLSPAIVIARPTAPAIFSVGLSSIGVTYGTVGADGYQVQASTSFTGALHSASALGQVSRLTVQNLDANTTYYLRVGALWDTTTFYAAARLSTSTLSDPVSATRIGGVWITSITVNWTPLSLGPMSQTAEGYVLDISTMASFNPLWTASSVTTDVSLSSLTICNLTGGQDYYFRVGSLNWDSVADYADPVSTALPVVLSLSLAPTTYAFGNIAVAASTNSLTRLVVRNEGNVDADLSLQAAVATPINPWTIGASAATAPAFDTLLLRAVFNEGRPALADYGNEDLVTGLSALSQTVAQGGRYTVNDAQTGISVPAGGQRQLWFRLDMPTSTTSAKPQTMQFTVRASQP